MAWRGAVLALLAGIFATQLLILTSLPRMVSRSDIQGAKSASERAELRKRLPVIEVETIRDRLEVDVNGYVDVSGSTVSCELDEPVWVTR
jgi:hypothetical protein